jgi:hypothetical protein
MFDRYIATCALDVEGILAEFRGQSQKISEVMGKRIKLFL